MATQPIVKSKKEVDELQRGLSALDPIARTVKASGVHTAAEYTYAAGMLRAVRDYKKDVKAKLNPFVDIARRALDEARMEMNKYLNQAEILDQMISTPMEDYKRKEREAAEAEQRRINEERRLQAEREAAEQRKRDEVAAAQARKLREKEIAEAQKAGEVKKREAERLRHEAEVREAEARARAKFDAEVAAAAVQDVTVRPNVPKIAGLKARVNWRFRVIDVNKLPRRWMIPDEQSIGRTVRDIKDKALAEAKFEGAIEVWSEDSI